MTGDIEQLTRRMDAMSRKMDHLNGRIDDLQDKVSVLERATDTDPGSIDYDALSRTDKVREIRLAVLRRAMDRPNGKAQMEYKEVRTLFNDHPSPGHCYDLMRDAGNLPGFEYAERDGANNTIRAVIDDVNDEALIRTANKGMLAEAD